MKPTITKTEVTAAPRKLSAIWTLESVSDLEATWYAATPVSEMSEEEQADEIVKRLQSPQRKPRSLEYELADELSQAIADEIDRELIETMKNNVRRYQTHTRRSGRDS